VTQPSGGSAGLPAIQARTANQSSCAGRPAGACPHRRSSAPRCGYRCPGEEGVVRVNRASGRARLAVAGAALCAALAVLLLGGLHSPARAAGSHQTAATTLTSASTSTSAGAAPVRHVVIVGISGLTWSGASPAATPELWRLAAGGSVGSLVDYAQQPLACPAEGWLTLNSAARAQGPRPCTRLPAVVAAGPGARIPALPGIIRANQAYHESPDWGLLGTLASCATAVGPGAALALASAAGTVSTYVPSLAAATPSVLARCPLTVVDLGQLPAGDRVRAAAADRQLAQLAAELPAGTLLLVTAPGAAAGPDRDPAGPPHLMSVVVSGPGYADGLLDSSATRRPGIVTLTDLTPTVAAWLGRQVPAGTVGARITRTDRGGLEATVSALTARDTAEQVWISSHGWFFLGYAAAAALAFGIPALLLRGGGGRRRRRRARCWRAAGLVATAVPLASYLANLFPWWELAHPAWWLYGMTAGWTLVVAAAALAGPWRRDPLGPFAAVCAATLLLLAVDVMTGSRLQLEAPFGLSLLVSGRFYGIGNDALGVYCVSALVTAAWTSRLGSGRVPPRLAAAAVGLLAVVASGWPGFGAKVGGTIALVPCLLLLLAWLGGARVGKRWAAPVAVSGLVLFLAFALLSYFLPGAGVSDMGTFAGNLLHGRGGDLLQRKIGSAVGSLTLSVIGWLIPVAAAVTGVALWQPAALRLRTLAGAFAALPLLRVLAWLAWLVLVIGWFADDSGVVVPAVALPFAAPLTIAMACSLNLSGLASAPGSAGSPAAETGMGRVQFSGAAAGAGYVWYRLRRTARRRQIPEVEQPQR
jgi:hypothetical protein